jgi:hypothetical protein
MKKTLWTDFHNVDVLCGLGWRVLEYGVPEYHPGQVLLYLPF